MCKLNELQQDATQIQHTAVVFEQKIVDLYKDKNRIKAERESDSFYPVRAQLMKTVQVSAPGMSKQIK